jgi:hypothetical protein
MAYARHSQFRAPNGRTIFDWFTGTGFLAVDAGAFFVALMVLLPWNLYSSPGDLWVAQPLRTWAFILTFHALVVGAIALARGIIGSPEPEIAVPTAGLRAGSSWSAPQAPAQPNRQVASTLLAQEWARRWLDEDRAEVAEMMQQSEEISVRRSRPSVDPMSTAPTEFTPWPEAPTPRSSIDAEAILADWLDEQASEFVAGPTEVDPLKSAARVRQAESTAEPPTGPPLDPELEWKWVEAAASAWLSKRDLSSNGHADSNGHA